jgi:hypothetical protein
MVCSMFNKLTISNIVIVFIYICFYKTYQHFLRRKYSAFMGGRVSGGRGEGRGRHFFYICLQRKELDVEIPFIHC